jgi:hypothetical protein
MNGLTKEEKIGLGLTPLQIVIAAAGLVVVIGLLMESGPEMMHSIEKHTWPTRQLIGNGLVTVGVFLEVALAIFVERSARREELQAERTIAETLERATSAEARTADLEIAVADARERQAQAEELIGKLRLAQAPRASNFDPRVFVGFLENRPKGTAEIWYQQEDGEAFLFASLLRYALVRAGWIVNGLEQIPSTAEGKMPAILKLGGQPIGLTVLVPSVPEPDHSVFKAITEASSGRQLTASGRPDAEVPEGTIRIIVGPKS